MKNLQIQRERVNIRFMAEKYVPTYQIVEMAEENLQKEDFWVWVKRILTERRVKALRLRAEGLSDVEAGKVLGVPPGRVNQRIQVARHQLENRRNVIEDIID